MQGNKKIVDILLRNEANLNAFTSDDNTPLMLGKQCFFPIFFFKIYFDLHP